MKKVTVLIILGIILAFILINFSSAQDENQPTNFVQVGIYVLNIGKYELATGSFTADFYLSLKCSSQCSEDFEFMNGRASSFEKIINEPNEKFYRIQANLNSPVDLKKFPFDNQKLQIILEDKKRTTSELVYETNLKESGVDDSISFAGWKIKPFYLNVSEHQYQIYEETYSQFSFNIPISRFPLNAFIKTFLPITFIILVALSSFVLDPDKITTRIGMVGSALVASVMFHVSLTNQIPPVGYLTFADKFMILTYLVLLLSFIFNVFLLELAERKNEKLLMRVHHATEYTMLIIVPILYLDLFLLFV